MQRGGRPDPGTCDDLPGFIEALEQLRVWGGDPSFRTLAKRVGRLLRPPQEVSKSTIADMFQPGRRRLNQDLVVAVARALGLDEQAVDQWRAACVRVHARAKTQARARTAVPSQLPPASRLFTGRRSELDELTALARHSAHGDGAATVVISAIDGMGGVGKSALAIHLAHRLRAEFPDGQLFIDLQGHTPGADPLTPGEALEQLLRSLAVPAQQIPRDAAARSALFRSRLADTRTLLVLDNAATAAQVKPLLPGTSGCLVLVTSRTRLVSLDDAHCLTLDVLAEQEAVELLHLVAGPGRIPAGTPSPNALAALCGRLPLALRIAAAQLRHRPALSIEDLVGQLGDDRQRLSHLEDRERDVTAVFDGSYTALDEAERLLLRRLGLVPGPDIDGYATASLLGTDLRTAERRLVRLAEHHMLIERAPGRYGFHDLVRLYARERSADDPEVEREAALERLEGYYTHVSATAARHIARRTFPNTPVPGSPPRHAPSPADRRSAMAWLATECANLVALAGQRDGVPSIALSEAVCAYLHTAGEFSAAPAVQQRAADLARALGHQLGEANALWCQGRSLRMLGDYQRSIALFEQCLEKYTELGNPLGRANSLVELGFAYDLSQDPDSAIAVLDQALAVFEELGHAVGRVDALFCLGRTRFTVGQYAEADALLERALVIARESGDLTGETNVLFGQGAVFTQTGDLGAATAIFQRILEVYQEQGDRVGQANTLWSLADLQRLTGDLATSTTSCEQALAGYREIGYRKGEADTLALLSTLRHAAGDHAAAVELARSAAQITEETGSIDSQLRALLPLGRALRAAGRHTEAADALEGALGAARTLGNRHQEAAVLLDLAQVLDRLRDPAGALAVYRQALEVAREIPLPDTVAAALAGIQALTG